MKRQIVFDLDETLITSSSYEYFEEDADYKYRAPDFMSDGYYCYKRNYVNEVLDYCFENYDVVFFTASQPEYAKPIADILANGRPYTIFTRESCHEKASIYGFAHICKDTSLLSSDYIAIDNDKHAFPNDEKFFHCKNYMLQEDDELLKFLEFIKQQ